MPNRLTTTKRIHLLCLAGLESDGIVRVLNDLRRVRERRWTIPRLERLIARYPIPSPIPEPVWTFDDQTRVTLPGHVTGAGPLAERLRSEIATAAWTCVSVRVSAEPGGSD